MKKIVSCLIAVALMLCAVASVSAEISPDASITNEYIMVEAIPVPDTAGDATPSTDAPGKVEVNSGEEITLTATPKDGYEFLYWEFVTGTFEIVSGSTTTPTIVIKPTGNNNIKAYVYFVEEDVDETIPSTKPVYPPSEDNKSPTTGISTPVVAVASSVTLMSAIAAVVVLRKKQNA